MGFFQEQDIDVMLGESPVNATIGAVTAPVFITRVGEDLLEGGAAHVQATRYLVTVHTGKFPALRQGVLIVIGSTSYKAVQVRRAGDGALTHVLCEVA